MTLPYGYGKINTKSINIGVIMNKEKGTALPVCYKNPIFGRAAL